MCAELNKTFFCPLITTGESNSNLLPSFEKKNTIFKLALKFIGPCPVPPL